MSRKHSLTEDQRLQLASWVNDIRRAREWSWREFAEELGRLSGRAMTDQTVRNASLGQGSEEVLRLVEQLTGETLDTRSRPETRTPDRYPSKRAAAEALRGIVDEEAIAAMLHEEHSGSDRDPGPDFWFQRGIAWNRLRHEAMQPATDLMTPPPMVGRPKGKKK